MISPFKCPSMWLRQRKRIPLNINFLCIAQHENEFKVTFNRQIRFLLHRAAVLMSNIFRSPDTPRRLSHHKRNWSNKPFWVFSYNLVPVFVCFLIKNFPSSWSFIAHIYTFCLKLPFVHVTDLRANLSSSRLTVNREVIGFMMRAIACTFHCIFLDEQPTDAMLSCDENGSNHHNVAN